MMPLIGLGLVLPSSGETRDLLKDGVLDAFRDVEVWRGVSEIDAVEGKCEFVLAGDGKILVNSPLKKEKAPYLLTREEFGDVRIELEFMVPKGSNAGVYVAGRYEVQILDSWGREKFGSGDLGGIYQRWDPTLPKGEQGFGGIKPKVNAAKPPGQWQTMEIVFRAPRFDEEGKKYRDATFEKVLVNGQLVQENATTAGHTRAAPLEGDAAKGPIAIQGDHGPIAIRSYKVTPLPDPEVARVKQLDAYWAEVSRAVNEGDFEAYEATCHPKAVLVSGTKKTSYPLAQALLRWNKEFEDTKAGEISASVDFRFSKRYGDDTTAYENGVFLYTQTPKSGEAKAEYIGFEALLVKEDDRWKVMMEYQREVLTKKEWDALAPAP
ncbi:MAG: family 16 glycoside hydrolase [Akkermansiaceae bacterium]